jgi:hypothetical protein
VSYGLARQIAPGVYHDLVDNVVHIDVPELLTHFGGDDTRERRELLVQGAIVAVHKTRPNVTVIELHQ